MCQYLVVGKTLVLIFGILTLRISTWESWRNGLNSLGIGFYINHFLGIHKDFFLVLLLNLSLVFL